MISKKQRPFSDTHWRASAKANSVTKRLLRWPDRTAPPADALAAKTPHPQGKAGAILGIVEPDGGWATFNYTSGT